MTWRGTGRLAGVLVLGATMSVAVTLPGHSRSADRRAEVEGVTMYRGQDRAQRLAEGARREGRLTLYVTLNPRDAQPLVAAFKEWMRQGYGFEPEIILVRGTGEDIRRRAIVEAQAGRFEADIYEMGGQGLEAVKRENLTARFWSPLFEGYPDDLRDPDGHWHAGRLNVFTQAYNTNLVRREQLPKTWNELLNPNWRGRMAIETSDWEWFATLVTRGPFGSRDAALAYFDRLRQQNLQVRHGHTLMAQLLAAGEFDIALTMYNYIPAQMKRDGAPVDWFVVEPAVVRPNGIAVSAYAPHPHLAMLFVDYYLSAGQSKLAQQGLVPASQRVESDLNSGFRYVVVDLQAAVDQIQYWESLYETRLLTK